MRNNGKDNWMRMISGRDEEDVKAETTVFHGVEDIIAHRDVFHASRMRHNINLPENVKFFGDVNLEKPGETELKAEVYAPKNGKGPFPALLYLHGGGWCWGSPAVTRKWGMQLAEQGFVVFNLDYARAPEHPYPEGLQDVIFAARWIVKNGARFNADVSKITIGGASAGANLASAAIVALTDDKPYRDNSHLDDVDVVFGGALLLFGVFDFPLVMQEGGSSYKGGPEIMYNLAYLGNHYLSKHRDPLVSPVLAPNLNRFPPTYISCGDIDPLVGQSMSMAKALITAGVSTELSVPRNVGHAYTYIVDEDPAVRSEAERIFTWLKDNININ